MGGTVIRINVNINQNDLDIFCGTNTLIWKEGTEELPSFKNFKLVQHQRFLRSKIN